MIEQRILSHLLYNENYARKVLPYLKEDYFQDKTERTLFVLIENFAKSYNSFPTKEALFIDLENRNDIGPETQQSVNSLIASLSVDEKTDMKWLIDNTETFCQDKEIYNAIRKSIQIIDQKSELTKNAIPTILQNALQVSFNTNIGHDFLENYEDRYRAYHNKEDKILFDIDFLNKITNGGFSNKTLNVLIAGTGGGKSLAMCHMAAFNLMCNKNVLYVTLEMSEEKIAQRIDANLLDVNINELENLSKIEYDQKIDRLRKTTKGKLIIKEYPTATAGVQHFRHLLSELRIKKNFVPDIIYVDYINLCVSSRIKASANINSYLYIKAIAEELRGLAVEYNLPIVTATQANRQGISNSDLGLENTADSIGLPMTTDFMAAIIATEELEKLGQFLFKQLKNRYNDPSYYKKFVVGVDKSRMRLYNCEQSAQDDLIDDRPVMDNTDFGIEESERGKKVFDKTKFRGFR